MQSCCTKAETRIHLAAVEVLHICLSTTEEDIKLPYLFFKYNNLLSNMETKYSVAEVCREDGKCHPLDPGKTYQPSKCSIRAN